MSIATDTARRTDLQALRGLAVIIVILFHSGLGILPSGYLGVDMFFVLSGYLITGILLRQRLAGSFRFADFYLRRARRLLPAAYAMLAVTIVAAMLLLTRSGYDRFAQQLAGALAFSTNIVLWRQINYFHDSAVFEPLLHLWSLGIEEQFYLFLPALLVLLPPRRWFAVLLVATLASLIGYLVAYPRVPAAAFYLLPLRAWELGLGALACFAGTAIRDRATRWRPAALLLLLAIPFAPETPSFIPVVTLLAGLAALGIIIARPWPTPALRPLAAIGDRSYSLYLVHWPLFAFANVLWLGTPLPGWLIAALLLATALLGFASYRYIEQPGQTLPIAAKTVWMLAAAGAIALALLGAMGALVVGNRGQTFDMRGVVGLPLPDCDGSADPFDGRCTQSDRPEILLWGDSFSQHLVPGITASTTRPIAQASLGGCPPLLGIALVEGPASQRTASECIAFNDSVLAYLDRTPSVGVVILAGRYLRYTHPGIQVMLAEEGNRITTSAPDLVVRAQLRTSAAIRARGRRVVIVSGPPQARFDVGQCWERKLAGLPYAVARADCAITPATAHEQSAATANLLDRFARSAATPVLRLDRAMCANGICATAWNGVPLYRDRNHLAYAGGELVGRRFALGQRAWAAAR
ncbi:acyltransferase family protein [Sphingomonas sp. 37zxx]|uniref:acyltransferase family protein n=1 Tax=Sphingomonas sp. 37zxx TaxID=1550073 RepID=UPI00053BE015|nr:acyltransferase family protein [Sphingomonas sp. 37zxx]